VTHSPITQALVKARKAFNKAAEALPEYEVLQKARAAHEQRQTSVDRAQRLLRFILKWEPSTPAQDLALFRQAATIHGYEELGHDKVQELIAAMNAIENRRAASWRDMATGKTTEDFTDEERREILAVLHPDSNMSPERREAAFKAFNAKR
jgi:hypothetical protein